MSKQLKWGIGLIFGLAISYWYASPYIVWHQIQHAVQTNDNEQWSRYVDYDSVKHSLSQQINAPLLQNLAAIDPQHPEAAALGAMLWSSMINKFIDTVISPQGLQFLIQAWDEKQLQPLPLSLYDPAAVSLNLAQPLPKPDICYTTHYHSYAHFEVEIFSSKPLAQPKLTLQMQREGLSWQVKAIKLP
jgi:hypothetical protein